MPNISQWFGEPDPVLRQSLLKLAEEASELSKAALRAAMIAFDGDDPDGGVCFDAISKELGDVNACVAWINGQHEQRYDVCADHDRALMKFQGFQRWEAMIREHHSPKTPSINNSD